MRTQLLLVQSLLAVAFAAPLSPRQDSADLGTSTTENGLAGPCEELTIIFARGTAEEGNVGSLAGPPFFEAVAELLGSDSDLEVQGVDYPASIEGFLEGGDPTGSATMASDVTQALSQCPSTNVVMAGYSQGGQLVHNAAKLLGSTMSSVNSVVIFGDPDNGTAVSGIDASKVLIICHTGDDICAGGDLILEPHLTYSENAGQAATFVVQQAGL